MLQTCPNVHPLPHRWEAGRLPRPRFEQKTCPRSGVQAVMSMQEHPLEAGRKAGRAVAADRRRRGVPEGSVELPPDEMRAVLAENGVTAGQSVAFLRAFWQGVTTA